MSIPQIINTEQLTSAEVAFLANISGLTYHKGDILYYDGTRIVNLGIGTSGQVLGVSGGIPNWGSISGTAGGLIPLTATGTVNGINTNFTFTSEPSFIISDGGWYTPLDSLGNTNWSWNNTFLVATMTIPPQSYITGFLLSGAGTGTVTSVSVVSANGLAGTVATGTTTPAITLSTSITGILKGNGTAISAATADTDYTTPTGTETFTNKTYDTAGTGNVFKINGTGISAITGTGSAVLSTSPTLVTPSLGTPSSGTLTNCTFPTLNQNTSGNAATVTTNANLTGPITSSGNATSIASQTGTGSTFVVNTSPTLVTPVLGVATATSVNGISLTAETTGFQVAGGTTSKTLAVSNTLTLAGTDSTTMTFPTTTATIARTDAAQTFTGIQTFSQIVTTSNAITATSNAATVPITSRISTVTNNSAATLTITITTTSAVDGQLVEVRVLDATGVAQTITWVNTENSTVTAPTTSNGSTTLPVSVLFQFNTNTTKWRCIASA